MPGKQGICVMKEWNNSTGRYLTKADYGYQAKEAGLAIDKFVDII